MYNFLVTFINYCIAFIGTVLNFILSVLPASPFGAISSLNNSVSEYLLYLGWVIPFDSILYLGELWLSAIAVYYCYKVLMNYVHIMG